MYSTCIFCNKPLGTNEVIEQFPVGRRIAFDEARGRLWVVCKSCERWNLSPIEERWEIVEECERAFSSTRIRTSTEHIGLARLSEGLELVRIGAPMRPEFAAWRYGDQFGRRRRSAMIKAGIGVAAVGGIYFGLAAAGIGIASFMSVGVQGIKRATEGSPREVIANVPYHHQIIPIKRKYLKSVNLTHDSREWGLQMQHEGDSLLTLEGAEARHALALLLPAINRYGGRKQHVTSAVDLLGGSSPEKYADEVARSTRFQMKGGQPGAELAKMAYPVRLALEMATHEEAERRALEGELTILEAAWREAEEIADIADNLLIPESMNDRIREMGKE